MALIIKTTQQVSINPYNKPMSEFHGGCFRQKWIKYTYILQNMQITIQSTTQVVYLFLAKLETLEIKYLTFKVKFIQPDFSKLTNK